MISVVIPTQDQGRDQARTLAYTLASLVPAAMDGFVREVIVADGANAEDVRLVAEEAGCIRLRGGIMEGLAAARSDWVLVVAPGITLQPGWVDEAAAALQRLERGGSRALLLFRATVDAYGMQARLRELWLKLARSRRRSQAMIAPRHALLAQEKLPARTLRARAFVEAGTRRGGM